MDPYAVLGVGPAAGHDEIRRAWLGLARRHHPDHGGDPGAMQAVNEAWALLGDPVRRRQWDREHGLAAAGAAAAAAGMPAEPEPEPDDDDLLDPTPLLAPRRSLVDLVPAGLFVTAVAVGCLALALDAPALLGVAVFVFFLSCLAVAAVAMLSLRRSVRAGRR